MSSTLFLEAFGHLSRDTSLEGIVSDEEDLYSVFRARAVLMSWCDTSNHRKPLLWRMEEAELTAGTDDSRIGWVQVGLEPVTGGVLESGRDLPETRPSFAPRGGRTGFTRLPGPRRVRTAELPIVLPALMQCFDDALRRFGDVELSGLQVTACQTSDVEPSTRSNIRDLVAGLNWFNTTLRARADALVAFDNELLGGHTEAELVAGVQWRNNGSFEFGPAATVPERHRAKAPVEAPRRSISTTSSGLGLSVTIPEWTASAVGWVLATVVDAARVMAPDVREYTIRITRVR